MSREDIDITVSLQVLAIQAMESARGQLQSLQEMKHPLLSDRALSIALMHLETAQLWVANARE